MGIPVVYKAAQQGVFGESQVSKALAKWTVLERKRGTGKANGKPTRTGNVGGSDGREAGGPRGGAVAPRKGRLRRPRVTRTRRAAPERRGKRGLGGFGTILLQPPNNDGDKENKNISK